MRSSPVVVERINQPSPAHSFIFSTPKKLQKGGRGGGHEPSCQMGSAVPGGGLEAFVDQARGREG